MAKEMVTVSMMRKASNVPWGFSLAGGSDQGLTHKIGTVRDESIADQAALKQMDYLWKVNGKSVFGLTHSACAKLIKESGTRLELVVERGDRIVPSFQHIAPRNGVRAGQLKKRELTGEAYYKDAMEDHGLPGKIPTRFTTCGKPFFLENKQFNSPIDVYDEQVIDEMVRTFDSLPRKTNAAQIEPCVVGTSKIVGSCRPVRSVQPKLIRTISDEMEGKWKK